MYHSLKVRSDYSEHVPYNIAGRPLYAGRSHLSVYRDMRSAYHWHDDLEFCVVLSGRMFYSVNSKPYPIEAGQGNFVNSRLLHNNYSADGNDSEYVCVLIHPSLLCADEYLQRTCVAPLIENTAFAHQILMPDVPWQNELMELVRQIQRASERDEPDQVCTQQSLCYRIAALLLKNMSHPEATSPIDQQLSAVRDMVGFVQRRYQDPIRLSDIAEAGQMAESTCCRIFRKHLGQTPSDYLTSYRLQKGMDLLALPGLSVADVALQVGYRNPSYFTESFRRQYHLTPSEYRRREFPA